MSVKKLVVGTERLDLGVRRESGVEQKFDTMGIDRTSQKGMCQEENEGQRQEKEPPKQGLLFLLLPPVPLLGSNSLPFSLPVSLVTLFSVFSPSLPPGQRPSALLSALCPWHILLACDALCHNAFPLSMVHHAFPFPHPSCSGRCPQHGGLLEAMQTRSPLLSLTFHFSN